MAVEAVKQIMVAKRLGTTPGDYGALIPLVDQTKANLGRKLKEVSGDTGFASEANIADMAKRKIRAYLTPGRSKHHDDHAAGERTFTNRPLMAAMAKKLKRGGRKAPYRLPKQTLEPVFRQIKQARALRPVHLSGRV